MISLIVELMNSLLLIFLLTELHRLNHFKQFFTLFIYYLIPWLIFNVIVHNLSINQLKVWFSHSQLVSNALSILISVFDLFCSTILIGIVVFGCLIFYAYFNDVKWKNQIGLKDIFFYFVCLVVLSLILRFIGYNDLIHTSLFLKVYIVLISFLSILYLDISRLRSDVTFSKLFQCIYHSFLYSILAIPFLMILISFILLLFVTLLEKLHFHPEDSHLIQNCVFYLTLYGPFYLIYWNSKKRYLQSSILPSTLWTLWTLWDMN